MRKRLYLFLTSIFFITFSTLAAQGTPMEEHKMLKMDEGKWQATISMWNEQNKVTAKYTAIETNEMIGELWSIGKLQGQIAGTDFSGFATLGYDPVKKKYIGTWIDSTRPEITEMEGNYDSKTKTLVLFYTSLDQNGNPGKRKNVMIYQDKKTRDFTMFIKQNEKWVKSMTILYQRIETIETKK